MHKQQGLGLEKALALVFLSPGFGMWRAPWERCGRAGLAGFSNVDKESI
jgi:hypothetical protein